MANSDSKYLEQISYAGIAIRENGDIYDNVGHPAGRRGVSEPPPRHRIAFSADDDEILEEWVSKAQAQNLQLKPKIFEDLESINPRHTAQSWQARWKKNRKRISQNVTAKHALSPLDTTGSILSQPATSNEKLEQATVQESQASYAPVGSSVEQGRENFQEGPVSKINSSRAGALAQRKNEISQDNSDYSTSWALPKTPNYPAVQSRITPGQLKGIEWMTLAGKQRFEAQEAQILSRWGVTTDHMGTCVLVPNIWSAVDPLSILNFDFEAYSQLDDTRLGFSMFDHATSWVRAGTWFRSSPHTGLEFDNFLGIGPFRPMEGSHLCHHGHCINPFHSVYEYANTNNSRKRCCTTAEDLRLLGLEIPKQCVKHDPPCLLQHAALTPYETYLIQFSVLSQARGNMQRLTTPLPPEDHPYATFESQLPLSFPNSNVTLDPAHTTACIPFETDARPVFYCNYCATANTFKSLPGYWAHVRDGHPLVSEETRMKDMMRAGKVWQDYKELNHAQGIEIDYEDTTWKQAEQMKEANFDWSVVLGWKLAYSRKRKFGKEQPGE